MKRPGSFSPAFCCVPASGRPPMTFASTASGACVSMASASRADEQRPRNTFFGGAWRAASRSNGRSRSSRPNWTASGRAKKSYQNSSGSQDHWNAFPAKRRRNWPTSSLRPPANSPARSTVLPTLPRWATFSAGHHSMPDQRRWSRPILSNELSRAFESFRRFDWGAPELEEMPSLFLRAARVVGDRRFDLPKGLRHQIAAKLENLGIAPQKTGKLKEFIPVGRSERISLHEESLPPGLILADS